MDPLEELLRSAPSAPKEILANDDSNNKDDLFARFQKLKNSNNDKNNNNNNFATSTNQQQRLETLLGRSLGLSLESTRNPSTQLSEQQQVDELLQQIAESTQLDQHYEKVQSERDQQAKARLEKLQMQLTTTTTTSSSSSSRDTPSTSISVTDTMPASDTVPVTPSLDLVDKKKKKPQLKLDCTICLERATQICPECDRDPYCDGCFREVHSAATMHGHKGRRL
jgi:hypothetical protein